MALYLIMIQVFGSEIALAQTLPAASMLLIVLSVAVVALILPLLCIVEVLTSKNTGMWKAIWVLLLFFFSWLGLIAYFFVARKDLK